MPLDQDQLHAFAAVARAGSFTRAASLLHLSQPALSRRITSLEEQLEAVLLVRGRAGATLTEAGRKLFAFVEAQHALEEDLLSELAPSPAEHRGTIRLAGLTSLVPPVVLPALAPFLRAHPSVQIEIHRSIDRPVIEALAAGRVDVVISQHEADSPAIVDTHIADEEFVMIESRDHPGRRDVFLDTTPRDDTTAWFLNAQPARNRPKRWTRSFLHDEPGILLGVELGLGRAVKPRYTIPDSAAVRIDTTFAAIARPVRLQYRRQRYYGRLQKAVLELVERAVKDLLKKRRAR